MPDRPEPPDRQVPSPVREAVQRWRLVLARAPLAVDAGQREQLIAWESALAQSGLPVAGLDADPPRPRFMPAAPLSATIPGEAELVDVWLAERLPAWRVREVLPRSLPGGYRLVEAYDVWLGAPALPGQVAASVYRADMRGAGVSAAALEGGCGSMLAAATLPRARQKGTGTVSYDLRPFLASLDVDADGPDLRMTLRHDPERGIGRPEEVLAELSLRVGVDLVGRPVVRERLVLAPPPAPPVQKPRPRLRPATGRAGRGEGRS